MTEEIETWESETISEGETFVDLAEYCYCLIRGEADDKTLWKYLVNYAAMEFPDLSEGHLSSLMREAKGKALEKYYGHGKGLTEEMRIWIRQTSGAFKAQEVYQALNLKHTADKKKVHPILKRLCEEGMIEKHGNQNGVYRLVQSEREKIDYLNVDTTPFDIRYPFQLERWVKTHPKNIVIVAGEQNAGKTAYCLNVALLNMNRGFPVQYMSSEMGALELRDRLENFDGVPLSDWGNVEFIERSSEFADIIDPDGLNIIDFLEILDNFWLIGLELQNIFNKLKNGVAVIALQKDHRAELGRGGSFALEKPRIYLTLEDNAPLGAKLSIRKAKNWYDKNRNPNRLEVNFKIVGGCKLIQISDWDYPAKKETKR